MANLPRIGSISNLRLHAHYDGPHDLSRQHLLPGLLETHNMDDVELNTQRSVRKIPGL